MPYSPSQTRFAIPISGKNICTICGFNVTRHTMGYLVNTMSCPNLDLYTIRHRAYIFKVRSDYAGIYFVEFSRVMFNLHNMLKSLSAVRTFI